MQSSLAHRGFGIALTLLVLALLGTIRDAAAAQLTADGTRQRIVMVLTNVDRIPGTDRETGFWAEEFVVPHRLFLQAGFSVTTASIKGGLAPVDRGSLDPKVIGEAAASEFGAYLASQRSALESTRLDAIDLKDVAAVFVVGGHGVMWDLSTSPQMHRLARRAIESGGILSAVCHGPGALARAKDQRGEYLLRGRSVTGFSAKEEEMAGMTSVVPYCLEGALTEASGGLYQKAGQPWQSHVVVDGRLVTGQNPASSEATAKAVLQRIRFLRMSR